MKNFTKILCTTALVAVGNHVSAQQLYDNFESTRLLNYPAVQGELTEGFANPASDAVNSSATCAKYVRSSDQYATITTKPKSGKMADVAAYEAGTKQVSIKFRGPAAGTRLIAVLQNSVKANVPNSYPKGKYVGDMVATSTKANEWETITFTLEHNDASNMDPTVTSMDIDQMVILIAPNGNTTDTYYIDDIMGPELEGVTTATKATSRFNGSDLASAYPNPTSGITQLPFSLQKPAVVSLAVYDNMGRRVAQVLDNEAKGAGQFTAELDAAKLASGLYTCRLTVDGVALSRRLSVQ